MAALHRDIYTVQFIISTGDLLFENTNRKIKNVLTQKQHQSMPFGSPELQPESSLTF